MFDYRQISSDLIKELPDRTKSVISRRFGLDQTGMVKKGESLESIGLDYGVTRERIRQIEKNSLSKIKNRSAKYRNVVSKLEKRMIDFGGLKKEDLYIESVGEKEMANHITFLLSVSEPFYKFPENKEFHSFWSIDAEHFNNVNETVQSIKNILHERREPLTVDFCANMIPLTPLPRINSYLEISKGIHLNEDGVFGLKQWPEINPRGIKDKTYITLKKHGKPLHFTEVAKLISDSTLPQTVHNELIKDSRFILIGRGIYALREWGYDAGEIKEVIRKIILSAERPLDKRDIVEQVLQKRIVKENTILQNLSNKKYFKRNSDGGYLLNS